MNTQSPSLPDTNIAPGSVDSASDARTVNNVMRHEYRVLSDLEKQQMRLIKDKAKDLHEFFDSVSSNSREMALAKTNLEQAVMWAVKHITR